MKFFHECLSDLPTTPLDLSPPRQRPQRFLSVWLETPRCGASGHRFGQARENGTALFDRELH